MVGSHQDSNIDHVRHCSWHHSPSQVEPTAIHKQDTVEKILEHRGEAEALPSATKTETLLKQSKRSSYMLSTLPMPQARAAIHQEGSTAPPFPPMGKIEPRVDIHPPPPGLLAASWDSTLASPHRESMVGKPDKLCNPMTLNKRVQ